MDANEVSLEASFVIIGGGIAGVTCAEQLYALAPEESVALVTASPVVKTVSNVMRLTRHLEEFDVSEKPAEEMHNKCKNLTVVRGYVDEIDVDKKVVRTTCGKTVKYKRVCITTGGRAKMIAEGHPLVLGIRDTESVQILQDKLKGARRVMIVGNGGIATELVYELEGLEVIWAIKHKSITATFVDPGAAEFFSSRLEKTDTHEAAEVAKPKRTKYTVSVEKATDGKAVGSALGPDWHRDLEMKGLLSSGQRKVHVEHECFVDKLMSPEEYAATEEGKTKAGDTSEWPLYVRLTNGATYGVDFVVSATGVVPVIPRIKSSSGEALRICAKDGGIIVDERLRSNVPDVFAAGDSCSPGWEMSKHWFQMRLWSQARIMGAFVGRSMLSDLRGEGESALMEFAFEIFAHVTHFFGYKVVFLGLFNGQGLGTDYDILLRVTRGVEYVKVVMQHGKMQGALLIGDTGLEETFENLILNQLDLSSYGEDLLHPGVDIEDYFD